MTRTGREIPVRRYPETVYEGLESAPRALAEMISGHTIWKTLVRTT